MRKLFSLILFLFILQTATPSVHITTNEPDSAYIFAYATDKNNNHNGLHFAWSIDRKSWHAIGPEHSFVKCDYGRWGSQKRILNPYLFQGNDGNWHCIWSLNDNDGAFAHAASPDLVYWSRQSYPVVRPQGNCLDLSVNYDRANKTYTITWLDNKQGKNNYYSVTTNDFKNYTPANQTLQPNKNKQTVTIDGNQQTGTFHKVAWTVIDNLQNAQRLAAYKGRQWNERAYITPDRFKEPLTAKVTLKMDETKKISDLLLGIFFEDINYAADGGLYAELIQNRGFEYNPADKEGHDKDWNSRKSWSLNSTDLTFVIDSVNPIHVNNKHYAVLNISKIGGALINEGFDGIPVKAGEKYDFSIFARSAENKKNNIQVRLVDKNGRLLGETYTKTIRSEWKKLEAEIVAKLSADDARIEIIPLQTGRVDVDMISLFPRNTFKGRKNGLRADLAQALADLKPRFVRFPGGCVAHGDGLGNIYRWENTIGSLEARKPQRNLWGYQQSAGLGYFEYFLFCEDLGAEPLPVVAAGVPCQNSAHHGCAIGGQQNGIPMSEMDGYVQSVLNLIEYANGDAQTSEWGRKRAEAGHPKPFGLKYLGVGNEDLITDLFEERFTMINKAIKEKYPEIVVIGTVGPFCEGTDYVEGWKISDKLNLPMVDEHYYQSPGWYLNNHDFYDRYDRSKAKVYLGEYAAHIPDRHNNIETALCEALHLANIERNGDIVEMASYAPLLAKEGYTQWNPNLIYFNNTEVKPTVGYQVQKLYGQNSGNEYIASIFDISDREGDVMKRLAVSVVKDAETGDIIIKFVNILPVSINTKFNLPGINPANSSAKRITLSGNLDDKQAKPTEDTIQVGTAFNCDMPARSFSIIRIQIPQPVKKK